MSRQNAFKQAVAIAAIVLLMPVPAMSGPKRPKRTGYEALDPIKRCLVDTLTQSAVEQRSLGFGGDVTINGTTLTTQSAQEIRTMFSADGRYLKQVESKAKKLNKTYRRQGWGNVMPCVK